ncbi:hypothetical protein RJ639_010578 [Escallonia herrerae]|uniref:Wall-associated receptor kinase galacturonan-binding domain-containing protein n=1 Tax=Escallonia herrerae TaxID=1293975 RepID=A0AA89AR93_9ASTE|nr:hypothetical protein RJ639_010578 [Escallonia herrerae]
MVMKLALEGVLVLLLIKATAQTLSLANPGCEETCGNVVIPYPFGIGASCSGNESFIVTCNKSFGPTVPNIRSINLQEAEGKFSKRNGDVLLKQQLSSGEEGTVEKTRVFTTKELEKAVITTMRVKSKQFIKEC